MFLKKKYLSHNILTATSPPTCQSLNKNAKVLVLVTGARPYLPESFWRRTPKSTRLNKFISNTNKTISLYNLVNQYFGESKYNETNIYKFTKFIQFLKFCRHLI